VAGSKKDLQKVLPKGMDHGQSDVLGHELRRQVPRSAHARWVPPPDRPDPVDLILKQDAARVPELVPLRHKRMFVSPFTFLRGAAVVMAHDLAATPATGLKVQACGDAHLANFGLYGTPERNLVFDVNDFDETLPAPWEWDIKRLAASFVVAGRTYGRPAAENSATARACVRSYREHIREMAGWGHLQVWYTMVNAESVASILGATHREAEEAIVRARAGSSVHELSKMTEATGTGRRFLDRPPLIEHIPDHIIDGNSPETLEGMNDLHAQYLDCLEPERRVLLERYRLLDAARKVVGVGSVGTRCAVALLIGATDADPLFLQVKEAQASVLEAVAGPSPYANHGERVVRGQRLCQAASDVFLGWVRADDGRDYYIRQLADMKLTVDTEKLSPLQRTTYAEDCGWVLARAHARSGDPAAIGGYLGHSDEFDEALVTFAHAYADQTERDRTAMLDAAKAGRIEVSP
jgi:uncharacterized protein (DUF2252 family)